MRLCSAQQLKQRLRRTLVATQRRGPHCLNVVVLAVVHGLLGLSGSEPLTLSSSSLISHLVSVDVMQHISYRTQQVTNLTPRLQRNPTHRVRAGYNQIHNTQRLLSLVNPQPLQPNPLRTTTLSTRHNQNCHAQQPILPRTTQATTHSLAQSREPPAFTTQPSTHNYPFYQAQPRLPRTTTHSTTHSLSYHTQPCSVSSTSSLHNPTHHAQQPITPRTTQYATQNPG